MTEDKILAVVTKVANKYGNFDGLAEDIAEAIIEDNGLDLSEADISELAEQYFENEEPRNWVVKCYNELDAEMGFDFGPFIIKADLTKEVAKSIARNLNKSCPAFIFHFAEEIDKDILDKDTLSVV